jgi:tRNA(Ile)-lysidine synthase
LFPLLIRADVYRLKRESKSLFSWPAERSMTSVINIVEQFLFRHTLAGERVCVAFSGGMDSIVLLDILDQLKSPLRLNLCAIHVHHGLSPNAQAWMEFCEGICAARNIALTTTRVSIDRSSSLGLEGAARAARYAAIAAEGTPYVLLAQHADDQAETVLHQMLRGTGLKGLAGMGEKRAASSAQTLLRPLLNVPRGEIEALARERDLEWIEDESNTDTAYTRNFLRHDIVPRLSERFPHYRESLARAARHASEADEMLEALAKIDLVWDGENAFADGLDTLPQARQTNAIYHWLRWQKMSPPAQSQLNELAAQLFRPAPVGKPQLAGGHEFVIRRNNNRLILQAK